MLEAGVSPAVPLKTRPPHRLCLTYDNLLSKELLNLVIENLFKICYCFFVILLKFYTHQFAS